MKKSKQITGTWQDDPAHFMRPSRREFLYVGLVGGLGLSLGDMFKKQAAAQQKMGRNIEPKALSVINIFLPGGMAAQETFDPKPYAPTEYRGPLGTIGTKLP
ncbi:MAG: DUF1501 domain-containing protein, partial [Verrucomicrobiota bacterium]